MIVMRSTTHRPASLSPFATLRAKLYVARRNVRRQPEITFAETQPPLRKVQDPDRAVERESGPSKFGIDGRHKGISPGEMTDSSSHGEAGTATAQCLYGRSGRVPRLSVYLGWLLARAD